ncbi:MAG: SRPBCC family protein, partial [Actinomycetes bacterium]
MQLTNTFTIDVPIADAWEVLNSPEVVAPCFPGATLTQYDGDRFEGTVKIKLGPISMHFTGHGVYVSRDADGHRLVLEASGRDSRGNGSATARVTGSLKAEGPDRTAIALVTD